MPDIRDQKPERRLSERIEDYRQEAQALVASGSEHHCWEFKQEWSIREEEGGKRLEFVKVIQGLANCEYDKERFLIIGASQKQKTFFPVPNSDEFDSAKISDLLGRYLEPVPIFECFNSLDTDDGKRFVVIRIAEVQPRPITVKKEGHDVVSKAHLRPGEVWVKRNTKLDLAARAELDQMYKQQIEAKAEDQARRRFAHFRDEIIIHSPSFGPQASQIPTVDLIFGPRNTYRSCFLGLLATKDAARLNILIELFRDSLISGWTARKGSDSPLGYMSDTFIPALECLVESGLMAIKNGLEPTVVTSVCDLIQQTYEFLRDGQFPQAPQSEGGVPAWEPALRTFCGLRALAVYSTHRRRFSYLSHIQRRFVRRFRDDAWRQPLTPFVFWPFPPSVQLPQHQSWIRSLWTESIERHWGHYFGDVQVYERAASEYELILELNSWIGVGKCGEAAKNTIQFAGQNVLMGYRPDLWLYPMRYLVPISQELLDSLRSGTPLLEDVAFVPESVRIAFSGDLKYRTATLGRFLGHVETFHSEAAMSRGLFPGLFEWEGALADAVRSATPAS